MNIPELCQGCVDLFMSLVARAKKGEVHTCPVCKSFHEIRDTEPYLDVLTTVPTPVAESV